MSTIKIVVAEGQRHNARLKFKKKNQFYLKIVF